MEAALIGCASGLCAFLFFLVIGGGVSRSPRQLTPCVLCRTQT